MRLKPDGFWKLIPVAVGDVETLVEMAIDGGGWNGFSCFAVRNPLFVFSGERLFSCLDDEFSSVSSLLFVLLASVPFCSCSLISSRYISSTIGFHSLTRALINQFETYGIL
ncbi:hypothetical protein HanRHA438_Chr13g0593581 [Helianthus annuus]|nr:hypothetical protein HanRHA438_Chr13g0593581 [Helianthus annuus]